MTGLIGFRWTHGNVWSREVLIVRGLTTLFFSATGHSILMRLLDRLVIVVSNSFDVHASSCLGDVTIIALWTASW
jgi:hypothetical protein